MEIKKTKQKSRLVKPCHQSATSTHNCIYMQYYKCCKLSNELTENDALEQY